MELSWTKAAQLHHRVLGIPQGGGIRCGNYHAAVRGGGCQQKAIAQARWGVQQAEVVLYPDGAQKGCHLFPGHRLPPLADRSRQQGELCQLGVGHHRPFQGTALLGHVGKIHQSRVGKAQGNIQVPQADVAVHAQHPQAGQGQCRAHAGGKGGFSGAALAGHHGDTLSHQ